MERKNFTRLRGLCIMAVDKSKNLSPQRRNLMKNRLLILCLVLVLCALSFAACGQKDTTTTTGKNPPSTSSSSTTATTTTTTLPAPDLTYPLLR